MLTKRDLPLLALILLTFLSLLLTSNLLFSVYGVAFARRGASRKLSYHIGPEVDGRTMQLGDDRRIPVLLQEDARFNYSRPDIAKKAEKENFPRGSGSYRSPGDNRAVFVSMYHQLHCVETMGEELISTSRKHWGHLQHCMNFLRELALCRPDLTLEPGDFTQRDFAVERYGAVHMCRDKRQIYDIVDQDWRSWTTYWHDHPELNKDKPMPSTETSQY